MSDDYALATGAPVTVTAAGRQWVVHTLRPRDFGEIEAWLKSVIPDPRIEAAKLLKAQDLPEAVAKHVYDRAVEEARENWPPTLDSPAAQIQLGTPEGEARILFQVLRRGQPALTLEQAGQLAEQFSPAELQAIFAAASPGDPGDPKFPTGEPEPPRPMRKSARRSRSSTAGRSKRSTT